MIKPIFYQLLSFLCLLALSQQSFAQQDVGLIVNEFSNGPSIGRAADSLEYIELLLVGCPGRGTYTGNDPDIIGPDPELVDIRFWIIDDNNGEMNSTPDTGGSISQGHIRFADNPTWANVPVGSIILIYNSVGFDSLGTGFPIIDDPQDALNGNTRYVLGINARDSLGNPLLEFCPDFPSAGNTNYNVGTCAYAPTIATSWQFIDLRNLGDGVQTREPNGDFFHGISYGVTGDPVDGGALNALSAGTRSVHLVDTDGTDRLFFFDNDNGGVLAFDNYRLEEAYSSAIVGITADAAPGTPAAENNLRNGGFIVKLQDATDAGLPQVVCDLSTNMAARGQNAVWSPGNMWEFTSVGIWSLEDAPTGAGVLFTDPTSPVSGVQVDREGVYIFRWTNNPTDPFCLDSDTVQVTFIQNPDPDAGGDLFVCGSDTILQAVPSVFGGRWEFVPRFDTAGVQTTPDPIIENPNDPNTRVSVTEDGNYRLRWIVGIPGCQDAEEINVQFASNQFAIDAGPDRSICGQNARFQGTGAGVWQILVLPFGGIPEDVNIADPGNPRSPINVDQPGAYTFQFVVGEGQICENRDEVTLSFVEQPMPRAGVDTTLCGFNYRLQGSVPDARATGTWTAISGPGTATFVNSNSNSTEVNVTAEGSYVFQWSIVGNDPTILCDAQDRVTVQFIEEPVPSFLIADTVNNDTTVCALSDNLLAENITLNNTVGQWTFAEVVTGPPSPTVNIADPSDPQSSVTVSDEGVYKFIWTLTRTVNGIVCTTQDSITMGFAIPIQAVTEPDVMGLCDPFITLTGNEPAGTDGEWSQLSGPEQADIETPGAATTLVMVTQPGTFEFLWTLSREDIDGGSELICATTDTITVEFIELPLAQAGDDVLDLCFPSTGGTATLAAQTSPGPMGTGGWFQLAGPPGVNFANSADPNTVVTVPDTGRYEFLWIIEQGTSCEQEDTVAIRFTDILAAGVAPLPDTICGLSTTLTASGLEVGQWTSNSNEVVFTNQNDPNTEVFVPTGGNYTFTWTIGNDICQSVASQSAVFLTPLDQGSLPPPTQTVQVFLGKSIQLDVTNDVPEATYSWTPDSTLSSNNVPNPIATPSVSQDYTVTITTGSGDAACTFTATIRVEVVTEIIIPNVFTPNGDGINDVWDVPLLSSFNNAKVEIFNRWGDLVFDSVGYDSPWDGKRKNGTDVPTSAYYYVIDFNEESDISTAPELKRGVVNIVR